MKNSKAMRVVLDAALSVMIVFEMLIQFTGEFLHEVIGFAFFATIIVHIALSAAWMKKTARNAKAGKLTARRTALAVIGCLLALTTVVLGVSSIAISGILASAGFVWPIGSYSMWATVHMVSSYTLCGLVVVHLAMHWAFLASAFKVPYNPSRRKAISTGVNAMAALGVLSLGMVAAGKLAPQAASASIEQETPNPGTETTTPQASGGTTGGTTTESAPTSGKHGKSNRGKSGGAPTGTGTGTGNAEQSGSTSDGTSGTSGTQNASGICTLCRKQCPLSSPKCNKPYEAGLL